jgi:hypothetical protein
MWRVALILLVAMSTAGADAPRSTCDAKALEQAGDDAWQRGDQVLALDKFEKAAQCQETTARHF